jgi:tripartite-type tricarboxylate transporter receptor subunit TctC
MSHWTRTLTAIVVSLLGATAAWGQAYPSKPVRLLSGFPPGGGADAVARIIGQALSEQMGQQIIVDTRAGASGMIANELAAKAPPDGYTLVLGNNLPMVMLTAAGTKTPYDPQKDFAPISLIAVSDYVLTVHPSLPAKSIKELVALAKAHPGKLTYASSGNMGGPHMAGELLGIRANVTLVHVPYKGTGPAAIGVISGETTMLFGSGPSVVPHLATGRLRGIATTGRKRTIPELPAIAEMLPGYEVSQWYGILVPAGVRRDIVERLHQEILRAVASPKVTQSLVSLGTLPETNTPDEFRAFIESEIDKWTKVMKTANIHAE